ncbi:MAG: DUF721 domain-containing protein [Alphaproteobacteria bacterium]|nr:DUF721 domain-containing protein [Alphaproteobacteria bacterium]MDE2041558.1 DUF721 domain-containing protein [Alphaproteobacteria bacterium]
MRRGSARAVADILPDIGGTAFRRFGFVQSSIVSRWAEIVGEQYAGICSPEYLRFPQGKRAEGVLTIRVASAHATIMQHVIPEIIARVNRFFGYAAVVRIILHQGMIETGQVPARPRLERVAIPEVLGESLHSVADPELRAVLESLASGLSAKQVVAEGKLR